MPVIHFQRPAVLLALALLPALAVLWWAACRRARRASEAAPGDVRFRAVNWTRGAVRLAALLVLVSGLADPILLGPGEVAGRQTPLVLILDVSASMEAEDLAPNRLGAAKDAVREICAAVPDAATALIAAAQDAAVVCPLTADRAAFLALLEQARTDWFGGTGSHLAPALERAAEVAREATGGPAAVVLVSDGEFHDAEAQARIARMKRDGFLLHTLVVGSAEGIEIRGTPGRAAVATRARPEQMAAWAEAGGGRAWSVTPQGRSLPAAAGEIAPPGLRRAVARAEGAGVPLAPWLYLLAAALLIAEWLIGI